MHIITPILLILIICVYYYYCSVEAYVTALQHLLKAVWHCPQFRELVLQLWTMPIRQIMNKSVQPHLLPFVRVIAKIVEMMLNGVQQVTDCQIRALLQEVGKFIKATRRSCTVLSTTQRQLAQEASEEMIESAAKAGTGQVVAKLTTKSAAIQAGKSAFTMGAVVDGTLLTFYTAKDFWEYKNNQLTQQEFQERFICNTTSAVGSTTVGTAGAAAGAAIGTLLCPGFGTVIGAMAGNVIGGTAGATAGCYVGSILTKK